MQQTPAVFRFLEHRHVIGRGYFAQGVVAFQRRREAPLLLAPFVKRDGAQPGAEAPPAVVMKLRHLADEKDEHFLHQIGGVLARQADAPRPMEEKRRVQPNETVRGRSHA